MKKKTCKQCKVKFEPIRPLQYVCSPKCGYEYVKESNIKKAKTDWQKEKKVIKEKLMTLSNWQDLLQTEINHIARIIDKDTGCISCGGNTTPAGGHYHSIGAKRNLRFNLDNIHLQDFNCNNWKSANIHEYDLGLINRYGKEYWNYVKFDIPLKFKLLKMPINEYKEKIEISRQIVKELKKLDLNYSAEVRLKLREKYNERLNIYK